MMSIRSLADFNWNSLGGVVTVGAITVTAQPHSSGLSDLEHGVVLADVNSPAWAVSLIQSLPAT